VFDVGYDDTPISVDRNAITLWLLPNVFNALVESFSSRCRVQASAVTQKRPMMVTSKPANRK